MTETKSATQKGAWLLLATFLVAVASLIYELIAATLSSYLLGDSVRQFSFVIGVFLSAMGLGAYLSRFVGAALAGFVWAQITLGIVGGFLAPVIYFAYAFLGDITVPLYLLLALIGVLSGMEIPLIARVLEDIGVRQFRFENVLTVDYVGALIASIAFPLLIIPHLGLMSASLAFGCLNLGVAGLSLLIFRDSTTRTMKVSWGVAMAASIGALVMAERMVSVVDANLFEDDVILSETTPYQQITITRFRERTRLFLDHAIQFDTLDEHRYHEALVHPAMASAPRRAHVLILGGGDGMATREVLRYDDVQSVTLVDLDPRVTELFREHPDLAPLNGGSLSDPRVNIVAADAWRFLDETGKQFDVIILDLPDPKNIALSKLYSLEFYALLVERMTAQGVATTQAGSPLFAQDAFWSIARTLEETRNPVQPGEGLFVTPYHTYVPSFGDWGFVMASVAPLAARDLPLPDGLEYLTAAEWQAAQSFSRDIDRTDAEPNSIQDHVLSGYYQAGWDAWFQ
ncbi:spermidine synthase [Cognatiyoonia koreensis]|uniref:Polyamine aminopropyltransferase n=1 Tax=Cognatiyoonia koreensis TaxID=364200 RepID=A0A1I0RB19_9RHOB|nr:polyamine aminopropyltransferase [Cognatiyoonia koreensis]SEW37993.1 spermidine synthase [Cognatiyoonia koreensis]